MKINNLSFPHPVLGIGDDVSGNYSVECQVELGRETATLHIKQTLSNKTLEGLILDKKAVYNVEVHCRQSLYRKSFLFSQKEHKISIASFDLLNKVEVNFFINAACDITNYCIDGSNTDYNGYSFEIAKGDILAYGGSVNFPAEKDWQSFMAVTSFMDIREYPAEEGPVLYELTQEKVVIQLAKKDFEKYNSVRTAQYLYPIFHSSIAYPALLLALANMKRAEEYGNSRWYLNLQWRLENEPELGRYDIDRVDDIPKIAQVILRNPIQRSLISMEKIRRNPGTEE
jgi:hypothetical protein